jgi:hypothetical protein
MIFKKNEANEDELIIDNSILEKFHVRFLTIRLFCSVCGHKWIVDCSDRIKRENLACVVCAQRKIAESIQF